MRLQAVADKHPGVVELERGRGLLRALVLRGKRDMRDIAAKIREQGVLVTVAGERAIRFTPPLVVSREQLDEAVRGVEAVVSKEPLG